jgi:hypothetical protein
MNLKKIKLIKVLLPASFTSSKKKRSESLMNVIKSFFVFFITIFIFKLILMFIND